jgi:hypothetical protein
VSSSSRGSVIHRVLGIAPGAAPSWRCSPDSCQGFDLLIALEVGLIVVGVVPVPARGSWWPVPIALAAVTLFWLCVHAPFERHERRGRARRRRGECVWCGRIGLGPGSSCPECPDRA